MKNYVFHLICKRSDAAPSETLLPIVDATSTSGALAQNGLLLVYKLPSNDPNAAISTVCDAKKRGWNPPIDQLSFFLNRTDDVFVVNWAERRLLTRTTFDALRNRGKFDITSDAAPLYAAEKLDANRAASAGSTETEPFEYLAFGDLLAIANVVDRRYFGSQTLSVE